MSRTTIYSLALFIATLNSSLHATQDNMKQPTPTLFQTIASVLLPQAKTPTQSQKTQQNNKTSDRSRRFKFVQEYFS